MRRRSSLPFPRAAALIGIVLLLAARTSAGQTSASGGFQQPIFGCRHAISCRNAPIGFSALNDPGTSGLLAVGSIRWGPGFHVGLKLPLLKLPAPETTVDIHEFHLRNVTLLPTPEPTPGPTPEAERPRQPM
jgi:hypothetical protein